MTFYYMAATWIRSNELYPCTHLHKTWTAAERCAKKGGHRGVVQMAYKPVKS